MGSNTSRNRTQQIGSDQKLIEGLNKYATTLPSLVIGGTSMTTKDIVAQVQPRIDKSNTALSARATWQAAVRASHQELDATATFIANLKQTLLAAFAGQVDVLADFGLSSRKLAVLTPEARVAAIAKMRATRAARHTMGSQQKKGVVGNVTGVIVTPVTAPAPTASPPAAPAPAAPANGAAPHS